MVESLSPHELFKKIKKRENLYLLDVRDTSQYKKHHFFLSINIPFQSLADHIDELPRDREIVTISNQSNSALKAADLLLKKGFNVKALNGGFKAWNGIYDIVQVEPIRPSKCEVFQVKRMGRGCLSYIVVDGERKTAAIIDPTRHIEVYLNFLEKNRLEPVAVIDTHIHGDHISGGKTLSQQINIPYLLPKNTRVNFPAFPLEDMISGLITDEKIEIIPTPGHSTESIIICLGVAFAFTGDTLFLEHVGMVDSEGEIRENAELLYNNIVDKLFTLDDNTFILPGHTQQSMVPGGAMLAASLRYIKRANGINKFKSAKKFIKAILENKQEHSAKMSKIREINSNGNGDSIKEDPDELEMGTNGCAACL